ncbi:MAG: TfoX/Sxy family protein [Rhizobiales bacterium]|nr:TfoX/Sxy family protein [Hyphomicrobiales bacterium]
MDADTIRDLFVELGMVHVRRMFGGAGIYAGGVMFGLVSDGLIYLKADTETVPAFEREKCAPFEYATKKGKRAVMSYWRLPDRLYDDPAELAQWARQAIAVARRNAVKKPAAKKSAKKPRTKRKKAKR